MTAFKEMTIDKEQFTHVVTHLKQVYMNELIKPVGLAR